MTKLVGISKKRIFFTILVACLLGIDVVVGSTSQYVWWFTNNFTGIIAAFIMFTAYRPREFLKPFYLVYSFCGILAVIGCAVFWYTHQAGHTCAFWMTVPLNFWMLGMAVLKIVEKWLITKEITVSFQKWEIIFAICMLLMLFSKSNDVWPLYYLVIFEALWHTPFGEEDKRNLFFGMMDGVILGFFLVQSFAYYNRPYDVVRYHGAYGDCNRNGCMYLVALAAFLSRNYVLRLQVKQTSNPPKSKKVLIGLSWLFAAAMGAFLFFTGCRTAMIGGIVMAVLYLIFAEKVTFHKKFVAIVCRAAAYVMVMIFSVPVVYATIRYIPAICDHPLYYGNGSWTPYKVQPRSPIDDERYISFEEALTGNLGRIPLLDRIKIKKEEDGTSDKTGWLRSPFVLRAYAAENLAEIHSDQFLVRYWLRRGEPDEVYGEYWFPDAYMTKINSVNIRILIYATYLRNMNLVGHKVEDGYYYVNSEKATFYVFNAQNVIVFLLFAYGVPTGILACVLLVYAFGTAVGRCLKGRHDCLTAILFFTAFWMMGMQEVVWIPGQIILFMVFFSIQFLKEKKVVFC